MSLIIRAQNKVMFIFIVLCSLVIFLTLPSVIFAEKEQANSAYKSQSPNKECLDSFNIDNIDLNDPKLAKDKYLLKDYLYCKAVVNRNLGYCEKVPARGECESYFNEYTKLSDFTNLSIDTCRQFRQRNSEKAYKECMAFFNGDLSIFKDQFSKNKALVFRAIKMNDSGRCLQTNDSAARSICLGYTSKDNGCEADSSFKEFRRRYCSKK